MTTLSSKSTDSTPKALTLWGSLLCVFMAIVRVIFAFLDELWRVPKGLLLKAITRRLIGFIGILIMQVACILKLLLILVEAVGFIAFALLAWHPVLLLVTLFNAAQHGQLWVVAYGIIDDVIWWLTTPIRYVLTQARLIRVVIRSRQIERLLLNAYGQPARRKAKSVPLKPVHQVNDVDVQEQPKPIMPLVWPASDDLTRQLIASVLLPFWSPLLKSENGLLALLEVLQPQQAKTDHWLISDPPAQAPPSQKHAQILPPILAPPRGAPI